MQSERIVVTGGHPTDAELAAVTSALVEHRRGTSRPLAEGRSRWIRAARLEGCGHPPIDTPMQLTRWVAAG